MEILLQSQSFAIS